MFLIKQDKRIYIQNVTRFRLKLKNNMHHVFFLSVFVQNKHQPLSLPLVKGSVVDNT